MTSRRSILCGLASVAIVAAGLTTPTRPAHASMEIIADLTPAEVHGLFNTLHRSRAVIGRTLTLKGSSTRTRFQVTRFEPAMSPGQASLYDSFGRPWVFDVVHEGLFLLRDVRSTETSSGSASVVTTQRAEATEFVVQSGYSFTWLPEAQVLLVESNDGIGRATQLGTYNVSARSATTIETEQGGFNFSLGEGSFGFDFSKAGMAKRSFFDALISGNPYRIERGRFRTSRGLGLTRDFTFEMEWASEALMDYEATLVNNGQEVTSNLTFKFLAGPMEPAAPMMPMSEAPKQDMPKQDMPKQDPPSDGASPTPAPPTSGEGQKPAPRPGATPSTTDGRLRATADDSTSGSPTSPAEPAKDPSQGQNGMPMQMAPPPFMIAIGQKTETTAATTANAFLARVRYRANPATLSTPEGVRELGQLVSHTILIDDFGSDFSSAQRMDLRSLNQFDLTITGMTQPIALAVGSRALGEASVVVKKFRLPLPVAGE